jgi:hypothetical protein
LIANCDGLRWFLNSLVGDPTGCIAMSSERDVDDVVVDLMMHEAWFGVMLLMLVATYSSCAQV